MAQMPQGVQLEMFDDNPSYDAFVDKFKPKKTTDDCYTPQNVYDVVADWVAEEYNVDRARFLRPFYPGGDYMREEYPEGCVVVDNPPFSIITEIQRFYLRRDVRFFLFAPTLTLFGGRDLDVTYLPCGVQLMYSNKAKVNTSFTTNLDTCRVYCSPELYQRVRAANDANTEAITKQLPSYSYPPEVLTAAAAYQFSHYGIRYRLEKADCAKIPAMDEQRQKGKAVFGCGFLLSERAAAERAAAERAAAERAAAERAAAHVWQLSEREKRIVKGLGKHENG